MILVLRCCGKVERNENGFGFGFWQDSFEAMRRSGICWYFLASTAALTDFSSVGIDEIKRMELYWRNGSRKRKRDEQIFVTEVTIF